MALWSGFLRGDVGEAEDTGFRLDDQGQRDGGVLAQELRIESRTLEDVFLELTGRELRS